MTAHNERLSAGLRRAMEVMHEHLVGEDVEEIFVNRPGELFVKRGLGACERFEAPSLTFDQCFDLVRLVANARDLRIGDETPLLTTALPRDPTYLDSQLRFSAVVPPCVEPGLVLIALRKQSIRDLSLADLAAKNLFKGTQLNERETEPEVMADSMIESGPIRQRRRKRHLRPVAGLHEAAKAGDVTTLLSLLVKGRRNIVVSGPTASGKTTVLNALVKEIPPSDRIITIEDAREVRTSLPNVGHLICPSTDQGVAKITARDLLRHTLRLSPTRILLSEIRGEEAYSFLESINTGHPGSLTSLHADSTADAKTRLAMAAARAYDGLRDDQMRTLVEEYVDVFVHIEPGANGRVVTEIEYL